MTMKKRLINSCRILVVICLLIIGAWMHPVLASENTCPCEWTILDSGWRFTTNGGISAVGVDVSQWQPVQVPHTWNAFDGADGNPYKTHPSYRRGISWYALKFPSPKTVNGGRTFLRFNGASSVADVYLNGQHLGQHRGAFGAFGFEITTNLCRDGENDLRLRVDNSWVANVAPLSGDFTMCGGLYRPVQLHTTGPVCISPLDHASPGVALDQKSVTRDRASVEVNVGFSRSQGRSNQADVHVTLMDATGKTILLCKQLVVWNGNEGRVQIPLNVSHPHLWNGVKDPYLYSVRVELLVGGEVQDSLTEKLGLRFFRADPKLGFFLNGEHYPLRGVSRHQDREGKGWAVSAADEVEDMAIIREMGANALRLAHFQQSESFLDLCDRQGMIVWAEIPLINQIRNTTSFRTNAEQQLVEMIRQQRNHSSIVMWGLFNELYHQGPTDPCENLVSHLQQVAKQEDSSRLTTAASNQIKRSQLNRITDLIACNIYPGWYGDGKPAQMGSWLKDWLAATNDCRLGVSEYGAGASLGQHEEWPPRKPDPGGKWHPEEYQTYCHEEQYRQSIANPAVWGSFAWNAFDFASDERDEGVRPGINDKGLVTYDRKTRKDAFYFYKANWNFEPMVHLNSRRFTNRSKDLICVRGYSNCEPVELFVNGTSFGIAKTDEIKRFTWDSVRLKPGENIIEVRGYAGGQLVSDSCRFDLSSNNTTASVR